MKTKLTLPEAVDALAITATFSEPRGDIRKEDGKDGWQCITYGVTLSKNEKPFWSGPYSIGTGHIKPGMVRKAPHLATSTECHLFDAWQKKPNANYTEKEAFVSMLGQVAKAINHKPQIADVTHSLLMDGSPYFDSESFEEWASNFGYDTDSRKAEKMYQECMETGRKLNRAFTAKELETLREAAQDY